MAIRRYKAPQHLESHAVQEWLGSAQSQTRIFGHLNPAQRADYRKQPMEIRDYLTMMGIAVTLFLFLWKLSFDRDLAKVRETISYLEKRSDKLGELWQHIKTVPSMSQPIAHLDNKTLTEGFLQLELIAYLVKRNAFDEEAVYQVCWFQFTEPLKNGNLQNWFDNKRGVDSSIYANYEWLSLKWKSRVADEKIGNPSKA